MAGPARVLIVDDEPNVRLMFRTSLETAGHAVVEAADGAVAIQELAAGPVDVVLLDIRMPVIDGMETLRLMRAKGMEHPVIMITAHGTVPDAVEALKLGAIDFIAKPVTPDKIRAIVADVLSRSLGPAATEAAQGDVVARAKRELNRRDFDKAQALLDRALDFDVDAAEAHYFRGLLLKMRGQTDRAVAAFRAALECDPNYEPARTQLAETTR